METRIRQFTKNITSGLPSAPTLSIALQYSSNADRHTCGWTRYDLNGIELSACQEYAMKFRGESFIDKIGHVEKIKIVYLQRFCSCPIYNCTETVRPRSPPQEQTFTQVQIGQDLPGTEYRLYCTRKSPVGIAHPHSYSHTPDDSFGSSRSPAAVANPRKRRKK